MMMMMKKTTTHRCVLFVQMKPRAYSQLNCGHKGSWVVWENNLKIATEKAFLGDERVRA